METKEYNLLDGRTIRAKYDRLGMCKISQENLESFVKEFDTSYRQAKILEKIKENYALMKLEERNKEKWIPVVNVDNSPFDNVQERKVGKWILSRKGIYTCSICGLDVLASEVNHQGYVYCPKCGNRLERCENE